MRIASLTVGGLLITIGLYFLIQTLTDELPLQALGYPLMGTSVVLVIGALLIKNGVDGKKEESGPFKAILVTKGRKTGTEHSVMLRAVKYNERFYFSRHRPDGDWFQNALKNSFVKIKYDDRILLGKASLVEDQDLARKVSELKYPGQERAKEKRVAIEVKLCE